MSLDLFGLVGANIDELAGFLADCLSDPETINTTIGILSEVDGTDDLVAILSENMADYRNIPSITMCALLSDCLDATVRAILADGQVEEDELITTYSLVRPAAQYFAGLFRAYKPFQSLRYNRIGEFLDHYRNDENCFGGDCAGSKNAGCMLCFCVDLVCDDSNALRDYQHIISTVLIEIMRVGGFDPRERDLLQEYKEFVDNYVKVVADVRRKRIDDRRRHNPEFGRSHNLPQFDEQVCEDPKEVLQLAIDELNGLVGLDGVKAEVQRLTDFLKVQEMRKSQGMRGSEQTLHFVFTGNPGTGKTTVARIVSKVLYGFGILKSHKLVETDRAGLVGGYVGQTAIKTAEVIQASLDGVLFIDEAYSLSNNLQGNDYGLEAINTLLKGMEDNRARLCVVVAGYTESMADFLRANPGLQSRFTRKIHFEDFSIPNLCAIFEKYCKDGEYVMDSKCLAYVSLLFTLAHRIRDEHFGNARFVRNIFEETLARHSQRIVAASPEALDKHALQRIEYLDLPFDAVSGFDVRSITLDAALWQAECPGCQTGIRAKMNIIGKRGKCKHCGTTFVMPWTRLIPDTVSVLPNDKFFGMRALLGPSTN